MLLTAEKMLDFTWYSKFNKLWQILLEHISKTFFWWQKFHNNNFPGEMYLTVITAVQMSYIWLSKTYKLILINGGRNVKVVARWKWNVFQMQCTVNLEELSNATSNNTISTENSPSTSNTTHSGTSNSKNFKALMFCFQGLSKRWKNGHFFQGLSRKCDHPVICTTTTLCSEQKWYILIWNITSQLQVDFLTIFSDHYWVISLQVCHTVKIVSDFK